MSIRSGGSSVNCAGVPACAGMESATTPAQNAAVAACAPMGSSAIIVRHVWTCRAQLKAASSLAIDSVPCHVFCITCAPSTAASPRRRPNLSNYACTERCRRRHHLRVQKAPSVPWLRTRERDQVRLCRLRYYRAMGGALAGSGRRSALFVACVVRSATRFRHVRFSRPRQRPQSGHLEIQPRQLSLWSCCARGWMRI